MSRGERDVHIFDNGVKVYCSHLIEAQRDRYRECNVHEPDEEGIFVDAITAIRPRGRYVSVGAAIGYYPILAISLRTDLEIHCFEPLARHVEYLKSNLQLNRVGNKSCVIHPLALTADTGRARFLDRSFGSHVIHNGGDDSVTSSVQSVSLSDMGKVIGEGPIDLLQMDIQGVEADVLEGYRRWNSQAGPEIRSFLIGTHGAAVHRRCREILIGLNYKVFHDQEHSVNQPDGILYAMQ